jgi:hypothetical protein
MNDIVASGEIAREIRLLGRHRGRRPYPDYKSVGVSLPRFECWTCHRGQGFLTGNAKIPQPSLVRSVRAAVFATNNAATTLTTNPTSTRTSECAGFCRMIRSGQSPTRGLSALGCGLNSWRPGTRLRGSPSI